MLSRNKLTIIAQYSHLHPDFSFSFISASSHFIYFHPLKKKSKTTTESISFLGYWSFLLQRMLLTAKQNAHVGCRCAYQLLYALSTTSARALLPH